jgi:hypothetical protein
MKKDNNKKTGSQISEAQNISFGSGLYALKILAVLSIKLEPT